MTTNINKPICCRGAQGAKASTALDPCVAVVGFFATVAVLAFAPCVA